MKNLIKSSSGNVRMLAFHVTGIVTGVQEIQTLTFPAVAGLSQADYIVISNVAGDTVALWIDIDADGTEPTGAAYVASDQQIMVSVATGDLAAVVAAAAVAALGSALADVTVLDNLDGTVTLTQDLDGPCTNPARHNANDSGNGGLLGVQATAGLASTISLDEGISDAVLSEEADAGQYVLTFTTPFSRTPVVVASCLTADVDLQIYAASKTAVSVRAFDSTDGTTAKDADFCLMVCGFDGD